MKLTKIYAIGCLSMVCLFLISAQAATSNSLSKKINLRYTPGDGSSTTSDTAALQKESLDKVLSSKLPNPTQSSLDELFAKANRVRVYDGGAIKSKPVSKKILLDTSDPAVLKALSQTLIIDEDAVCQELSIGGPTIEFMQDKKRLAVIVSHHSETLRWESAWHYDVGLHYGRHLVDWFADNGIDGPKLALESELKDKRRTSADLQKWMMSMPECLRPSWGLVVVPGMSDLLIFSPLPDKRVPNTVLPIEENPRTKQIMSVLDEEFSDPHIKILSLLQWYASGVGTWTGFPSYEELPAELLLTIPTQTIVDALHLKNVSDPEIDGAARYFASHLFRVSKPQDLQLLDPQLKDRLLKQCLKSDDNDKRYRAESAFNSAK